MKIRRVIAVCLLAGALLAACTPAAQPGVVPQTSSGTQGAGATQTQPAQPAAVTAAQAALAQKLGVETGTVSIESVKAVTWPNSCLGYTGPDEMCAEVLTSGYSVVLKAGGKTYEVHTNQDGSHIRTPDEAAQSNPTGTPAAGGKDLPAAVLTAQQMLAQQLQAKPADIQVVKVEEVEWPDGCLGVQQPGRMCTQMVTPGYRVIFETGGKQYEFHTDHEGGAVLLAMAPMPQTTEKLLVWEQTENNVCSRAEIGVKAVAFGSCGGKLMEAPLQQGRAEELASLLATYAPFTSGTRAGTISFNGEGTQPASEAEQRSIAEWARLVNQEAQSGRSGAAWGLAFSWHREGGIAGFCDDLTVYLTGWALPSSCKGSQPKNLNAYRLTADQLDQLYRWIDQFAGFEFDQSDHATADSMAIRMVFSGAGTQTATQAQQEEIARFAGELYASTQ